MQSILKQKRITLGLSQRQLANLSGISFRTLQDYEQGRKSLLSASSDVVFKLSQVLNCHMEDLIIQPTSQYNDEEMIYRLAVYSNTLLPTSLIGQINIEIDELVACLRDTLSNKEEPTVVFKIESRSFLSKYNKQTGWHINWSKLPSDVDIYALATSADNQIQGLIALHNDILNDAIYIHWACTAPHNNIHDFGSKKYSGVGGHLFAIAAEKSFEQGHSGYIYGFANNKDTLAHYVNTLNALPFAAMHPYQFIIDEDNARNLIEVYNYEWNNPS